MFELQVQEQNSCTEQDSGIGHLSPLTTVIGSYQFDLRVFHTFTLLILIWCRNPLALSRPIQQLPHPWLGVGAMEGELENKLEKSLSARTALAASEGWKASQKTYSWRFLHNLEFGMHRPPTDVSTLQHEVLETLNPAWTRWKDLGCHLSFSRKFLLFFRKERFNYRNWWGCWSSLGRPDMRRRMWVPRSGAVHSERWVASALWHWTRESIHWLDAGTGLASISLSEKGYSLEDRARGR